MMDVSFGHSGPLHRGRLAAHPARAPRESWRLEAWRALLSSEACLARSYSTRCATQPVIAAASTTMSLE